MEFVWNDGGRAACGFVGSTGDCVTRAISIATGSVYRDVYEELGEAAQKSPRCGFPLDITAAYLEKRKWRRSGILGVEFDDASIPDGVVIVQLSNSSRQSHHLCTVVDHVVHDTWNPSEGDDYSVDRFWVQVASTVNASPTTEPKRKISKAQELTQQEFDRVMRILRALEKTASNQASTEGEKRNALRMIQNLMLTNNLTREDITGADNVDNVQFTRMACPVNGRRACNWEKNLAMYIANEVLPTVQCFRTTKGPRTLFWFYGPLADVQNAIALYRELILTIATAASLQYSSYSRGSGASYAEGYVAGLPRPNSDTSDNVRPIPKVTALIQTRMLAIKEGAKDWLNLECDLKLVSGKRRGRYVNDPSAEFRGKVHGSHHDVKVPNAPKRISNR